MPLINRILIPLVFLGLNLFAAEPAAPALQKEELERNFKEMLSGSTFKGRWCLVRDGELTEEREETYTIQGATKSGQDVWLIYARIQYGGKDVSVPVPVQVKWAGDTAVITLDNVSLPGLGTYSARVLVYNKTYAGTWSAGDHGGMLHGIIVKGAKKEATTEKK